MLWMSEAGPLANQVGAENAVAQWKGLLVRQRTMEAENARPESIGQST